MKLSFRKKEKRVENPQPIVGAEQFPDVPAAHLETYHHVCNSTMTSPERIFSLCHAVDYLGNSSIAGDIVECGVWKGGSMMAVARTLLQYGNDQQRKLWLYDTFEGMSPPSGRDIDLHGSSAQQLMDASDPAESDSVWCRSSIAEVKENIQSTGYALSNVRFIVGPVENTLQDSSHLPDRIALLRLDTDWFESTRIELQQLFPRLVPGGVLIIDDYGHWEGCRQAVDEYFAEHPPAILLHRIDYTGRIGIKHYGANETTGVDHVA